MEILFSKPDESMPIYLNYLNIKLISYFNK